MIVLDPTQAPLSDNAAAGRPVAPRLATLDGKVLGLWNNQKLNAAKLLEFIREELEKRFMRSHFESALRRVVEFGMPEIRLVYPTESGRQPPSEG